MAALQQETPASLGYRMPAEWEPHEATWIAWPHNAQDWPGKFQGIQWVYVDIVRHLSEHERVHVLVNDQNAEAKARTAFDRSKVMLDNIQFHQWRTDRVWTRDSGPIWVRRGGRRCIASFRFNGWAKYPDWKRDVRIPERRPELLADRLRPQRRVRSRPDQIRFRPNNGRDQLPCRCKSQWLDQCLRRIPGADARAAQQHRLYLCILASREVVAREQEIES